MPYSPSLAAGLATAVGLIWLSVFSTQSPAQTADVATTSQTKAPSLQCNGERILDPFHGNLAGPDLPGDCCRSTTRSETPFLVRTCRAKKM